MVCAFGYHGFAPSYRYTKENTNNIPTSGRNALLERLRDYYKLMAEDYTQATSQLDKFKNPFIPAKAFTLDNAAKLEGITPDDATQFLNQEDNDLVADLVEIAVDYGYGGHFEHNPSSLGSGPFGDYEQLSSYPNHPNIIGFNGWGFIDDLNNIAVDDLVTPIGNFMIGGEYGNLLGDFGGVGAIGAGLGALASMGGVGGGGMGSFGGKAGFGGISNKMDARANYLENLESNNPNGEIKYDFSAFENIGLADILGAYGSGLKAPSFDTYAAFALNNLLWQNLNQIPQQSGNYNNSLSPSVLVNGGNINYSNTENYNPYPMSLESLLNRNDSNVRKVTLRDLLEALGIDELPKLYDPFADLVSQNEDLFRPGGMIGGLFDPGGGGGALGASGSSGGAGSNSVTPALGIDFYAFIDEFDFSGLVDLYLFLKGIIEELNLFLEDLDLAPYRDFLNKIRTLLDNKNRDPNSLSSDYGKNITPPTFTLSEDDISAVEELSKQNNIEDGVASMLAGFIDNKRKKPRTSGGFTQGVVLPSEYLPPLNTQSTPGVIRHGGPAPFPIFAQGQAIARNTINVLVGAGRARSLPQIIKTWQPPKIVKNVPLIPFLPLIQRLFRNETYPVNNFSFLPKIVSSGMMTRPNASVPRSFDYFPAANIQARKRLDILAKMITPILSKGFASFGRWQINNVTLIPMISTVQSLTIATHRLGGDIVPSPIPFTLISTIANNFSKPVLGLNATLNYLNKPDILTIQLRRNQHNTNINTEFTAFILGDISGLGVIFVDVTPVFNFFTIMNVEGSFPDRSMVTMIYPHEYVFTAFNPMLSISPGEVNTSSDSMYIL